MPAKIHSLSIALCTCNGAEFLDEQMQSLREQAGVSEIVVVDDASTDDTWSILLTHASEDARIKLYQNAIRLGVTANFQRAISLATSQWIALADQDDIWLSDKLSQLCDGWDGHSELIHHASHKFRGNAVPVMLPKPAGERRKFSGRDLRRLFYRNTIVGHATVVSADLVRRLMPFPPDVPHDWWIGVGAAGYGQVQYVDEYFVHYRIHRHNAYHCAGSRFRRLRTEHQSRVRLLQALLDRPGFFGSGRNFAEDYLRLLQAAASGGSSWSLWRFYMKNAGLFFSGGRQLSRFTRLRKSFSATIGAMMQKPVTTAGEKITLPSVKIEPALAQALRKTA